MSAYSRLALCSACIALLLVACMASGCTSSQTTPAATASPAPTVGGTSVAIKNFAFEPPTQTVKTGTVITWANQDGAPHTIVSDAGSPEAFSSESLSTGASYTYLFNRPGTYTYHCSIHPSMKGTVIVQA